MAAAISWLTLGTVWAADTETLTRVKKLYLSASYEEALSLLNNLSVESPSSEALQAEEYRAFCLLALGRDAEAQKSMETLVKINPAYLPSETASPRIRAAFMEVRRRLIPAIVQSAYAEAKAAFDRNDPRAVSLFDRVLALLADPELPPAMADLKTVAAGFRDLSAAAAAPARPPEVNAANAGAAAGAGPAASTGPATGGTAAAGTGSQPAGGGRDAAQSPARQPVSSQVASAKAGGTAPTQPPLDRESTLTPPEAVFQPMPTWTPENSGEASQTFRGTLELSIDENGNVVTARMRKGAHPRYDELLVKAAQTWRFKPARRDGVAIPYLRVVEVELRPFRQ